MLRTSLVALLLLATPTAALAAPPANARLAGERYQDPQGRFAARFPSGWLVAPDQANMTITTARPIGGGGAKIQIVAAELPGGRTLDAYVKDSIEAWQAIWTVRSNQPAKLGPLDGRRLVIEQQVGGEVTFVVKWFAAYDGHVYVYTGSSPLGEFPRVRDAIDAGAATFEPGDWQAADAPTPATAHEEGPVMLELPAGWKLGSRLPGQQVIWKKRAAGVDGTIVLRLRPRPAGGPAETPQAVVAAEKETFVDDAGYHVLTEGPAGLGGEAGLRLVSLYRKETSAEWEAMYVAPRRGTLAILTFQADGEAPNAALRADFDQVLAGFRWK